MVLKRRILLLKTGVWTLGFTPLAWVFHRFLLGDGLGANPVAEAQLWGGLTSLSFLFATLSITPLRRLTGWNDLQKVRRLVGLFAFFYVTLHFLIWIGLDQFFAWRYIIEDIAERPYIMVGFTAFVLLIPMAVTSTKGWIRRLGKRWVTLHRLVYVSALLGVIHFFWITKADDLWPTVALAVWMVLMSLRLVWWLKSRIQPARARRLGGSVGWPASLVVCAALSLCSACASRAPTVLNAPESAVEAVSEDLGAFRVYAGDGRPASLPELVTALGSVSVLLVGEEHDDSIAHRVKLLILEEGVRRWQPRPVVLSLEMFEQDVQEVVDEYLGGFITEPYFLAASRPWAEYRTAYRPLVEFAKVSGLRVVAANVPRRYVDMVSRTGEGSLEGLPRAAFRFLPPLPLPAASVAYRARFDSAMFGPAQHDDMPPNIFAGQRLWDAGMASAVAAALDDRPDALVIHLVGAFHVERRLGIAEALIQYRPRTTFLVVSIRRVADPTAFDVREHTGLGDFVVLTRE